MPLVSPIAPYMLFENSLDTGGDARSYLFTRPRRWITCTDGARLMDCLEEIDAAAGEGLHAAGWIAYEAGYWLEERLAPLQRLHPKGAPLLTFGIFDAPQVLAPRELEAFWVSRNEGTQAFSVSEVGLSLDEADYVECIEAVKDYLAAGDIYEANFTLPCHVRVDGNVEALHKRIRQSQRVPYGAVLALEDETILSYSPELFIEKRGTRLSARPMKGTSERGFTVEGDAARRAELRADIKQRAELLMIVDLLRNDLGRLARVGSVNVTNPYHVEAYRTVLQMTSTVSGEVAPDLSLAETVRSLFPCGSITGAPKIRAMEIIARLEGIPRGVYTGAIGFLTPERDFIFNVPIRTLRIGPDGAGVLGVGSGIVADSDPRAEYRECRLKASFFAEPQEDFALIETMRAEGGTIPLLDLHLARLEGSARYFGFPVAIGEVRAEIEELLASLTRGGVHRLRLLLDRTGETALLAAPYLPPGVALDVGFAAQPVDRRNPFLYHKTTARRLYTQALGQAAARGLYDVIFTNEAGEVTEGARSNIIIERGGRLVTPPVASGLLGGVARARLIREGRLHEEVLRREDLLAAEKVYLSNALVGLQPARLRA